MSLSLRAEDGRAMDLLLDRSAAVSAGGNGAFHAHEDDELQARLYAAQKWLSMLDMLPAPEPQSDLAARTLDRVNRSVELQPSQAQADLIRMRPQA